MRKVLDRYRIKHIASIFKFIFDLVVIGKDMIILRNKQ